MRPILSAPSRPVHRLPLPPYAIGGVPDSEYVSDRDRAVGYFGAGKPAVAEIPQAATFAPTDKSPAAATAATNSAETLAGKLEDAAAKFEDAIDDDVAQFLAERFHDLAQEVRFRGIRTVEGLREHMNFRY